MRSLSVIVLCSLLAQPARGEETFVTIKGQDYLWLPYDSFMDERPKRWFTVRFDKSAFKDRWVIIPFGKVFCDLRGNTRLNESGIDKHKGQSMLDLNEPVGHFFGASTRGYLTEEVDVNALDAASAACEAMSKKPGQGRLFKDPLFFFYGRIEQTPSDRPNKFGEPHMILHGAQFSGQYGQSAWFPSYGAKPPEMALPKGDQ